MSNFWLFGGVPIMPVLEFLFMVGLSLLVLILPDGRD